MKKAFICLILACSITLCSCGNVSKNNASSPKVNVQSKSDTIEAGTVNDVKNDTGQNLLLNNSVNDSKNTQTEKTESKNTENTKTQTPSTESSAETKKQSWFYEIKTDGTPSGEPKYVLDIINKHEAYYLGDTSQKIIYLTFDEGYENGYSSKILDILKEKDVKAAFFVTTPYMKSNKELVKRMADEGHLVCNHSTTHPSMPEIALKSEKDFKNEIQTAEDTFKEVTGKEMAKFFRPPMGEYSELSLKYTDALGYKTIFWSFAYNDWNPDKQPDIAYAKKTILERTHPGGIYLLHAVSKTNTEILPSLIDEWKSKGYTFKTLDELPQK